MKNEVVTIEIGSNTNREKKYYCLNYKIKDE